MLKNVWRNVHNLEDLLVECAEMCNFTNGVSKLVMNKNEAYLLEKEAKEEMGAPDLSHCEMYRYLSAM